MTIENLCEFIKKIHANPLAKIEGLSIREFYMLKDHLTTCQECDRLAEEIVERYKDVPTDPNLNDGRFN